MPEDAGLPWSPEQWASYIHDAVQTSGRATEVVTGLEVTMSGWRVTIAPPVQVEQPPVVVE